MKFIICFDCDILNMFEDFEIVVIDIILLKLDVIFGDVSSA